MYGCTFDGIKTQQPNQRSLNKWKIVMGFVTDKGVRLQPLSIRIVQFIVSNRIQITQTDFWHVKHSLNISMKIPRYLVSFSVEIQNYACHRRSVHEEFLSTSWRKLNLNMPFDDAIYGCCCYCFFCCLQLLFIMLHKHCFKHKVSKSLY